MLAPLRRGVPCAASALLRGVRAPTTVARMAAAAPPLARAPLGRPFGASARRFDAWTEHTDVTYAELKPLTEQPTGEITLIDVREPAETQEGMIPSAVNLPLSELPAALKAAEDDSHTKWFTDKFSFPPPAHNAKIIVYCRSGKRSQKALDFFRQQGFKDVRNYRGSWLDWEEHKAKGQ